MTGHSPIVERALQVHGHLEPHEYQGVLRHWANLDHRLQSFADQAIEMRLFIDERDTPSQHVTLEVKIPGHPMLIATAKTPDLGAGLREVRDVMVRQITDLKTRTEPRHARTLRESGRGKRSA